MNDSSDIPANHTLALTTPSEVALRRAKSLSRELKKSARDLRVTKRSALDTFFKHGSALQSATGLLVGSNRWIGYSFVILAVVPSILCTLYFSLIASSQYLSETRFAVRAGAPSTMDAISNIAGLAMVQQAQDSFIVSDYIKSRAIVEQLDRRVGLRDLYSRRAIDYISRFDKDDSVEDLVSYWRWKVSTSIENPSGIVTVDVRAFSPQDALAIGKAIVELSENEINRLNARAERDLVSQAQQEVQRAENSVRDARVALREFRNKTGIIDPHAQADSINSLIDQIKTDRIQMEQQLTVISQSLSADAPQVQDLRSRIKAANDQIAKLQSELTAHGNAGGGETLARLLVNFEKLELGQKVAEKQYTDALAALESARVTAERRRLYLNTFVEPMLPQEADQPKRFWYSVASIAIFLTLWSVLASLWAQLRYYLA